MKHENINPLLDRLYEKRESLDHGIELIDKKIEAKLAVIDNEKNKVWLPADDAIIETAEIEKNVLEKEKLSLQVFRANIELQIFDKEFNRDRNLGIVHSQNEISRHEKAKENIIIITRMNIKKAADTGIITRDQIQYYNESIEPTHTIITKQKTSSNRGKQRKRVEELAQEFNLAKGETVNSKIVNRILKILQKEKLTKSNGHAGVRKSLQRLGYSKENRI